MSVLLKAKHRLNIIPIKIPMAFFRETEKNSCKIGIDLHCHSVAKLYSTLCNPMGCSTPGFSVPPISRSLPRFMFIESAMPSHPLSPSSPSAFGLSQHQGLFQWVSCSHQVAKVLELQLQHQSFQRVHRVDFLCDWLVWSPRFPRDSRVFASITDRKHQFDWVHFFEWPNQKIGQRTKQTFLQRRHTDG